MSRHILVKGAAPSAPSAGKVSIFFNSASGRFELLDGDNGLTYPLQAAEFDKNLLINGGFDFAQRQAPGTLTSYATSANRQYAADRWAMMVQTSSLQYQRVDTIAATEVGIAGRYYGKYKQITGAGKAVLFQWIEGNSTGPLRGRKVRVQLKMKRTVAAAMTVRIGLVQLAAAGTVDAPPTAFVSAYGANGTDPTFGANIALIAPIAGSVIGGSIVSGQVQAVLGTTWVNYGAAYTVPSDCKNLAIVIWTDSQLAINDELNLAEAGTFDGPDVIDWIPMPYALDMRRAQRFYAKSFDIDTNPAQNAGALTGEVRAWSPVGASLAFAVAWTWEFPVNMLKAPTLTLLNPQAANAQVRNQTLATDCTVSTATADGTKRMMISGTTPASTAVGNILGVHVTADAEI